MFSVAARPFNSKARQLYGGWTPEEAAGNLWGMRKAYDMIAKYGTDPGEVQEAKSWLKAYRKARKDNPVLIRQAMNATRKLAGLGRYYPKPLTKAQKDAILQYWQSIPFSDKSPLASYRRALVSKAPYPPYGYLIANPHFARPEQDLDPAIMDFATTADQLYTTGPTMATGFFADPAQRTAFYKDPANSAFKPIRIPKGYIGDTNAEMIQALARQPTGVTPGLLNRAINRVKAEDDDIMG